MAKTVVNLSDQVSTWLSKTNTISDHVGDVATLTSGDSNVVDAINAAFVDINTLLSDPGVDSDGIRALFVAGDGLDYDSSTGIFSIGTGEVTETMIGADAISQNELKDLVTLVIYDSDGTTLKTLYGAGS